MEKLEAVAPVYSELPMPLDSLSCDEGIISAARVIDLLSDVITKERIEKIDKVVSSRTNNFIPVLENIYDRGNINAVMRSAEAFGFYNFYIVEDEDAPHKESNRITKGTHKWLDIHKHNTAKSAVSELKGSGVQVFCTHLEASRNIADIDFTKPTALVFGNEAKGVSDEMLELCDGNCIIPMEGFAQSFNISVAAAISFYHVYLKRVESLGANGDLTDSEQEWLKANYFIKSFGGLEKFKKLVTNKEA